MITTFVANGKTYEVIGAENAENVTVEFATVAPAAKNGTKYELVVFDGKVAVTTGGFIEEAESTIPAFDGWGQILEAEIKFTPSDETDSMLGDEETAPVVEYAKVKVLNNKGEVNIYDMDAYFKLNDTEDGYDFYLVLNDNDEYKLTETALKEDYGTDKNGAYTVKINNIE